MARRPHAHWLARTSELSRKTASGRFAATRVNRKRHCSPLPGGLSRVGTQQGYSRCSATQSQLRYCERQSSEIGELMKPPFILGLLTLFVGMVVFFAILWPL